MNRRSKLNWAAIQAALSAIHSIRYKSKERIAIYQWSSVYKRWKHFVYSSRWCVRKRNKENDCRAGQPAERISNWCCDWWPALYRKHPAASPLFCSLHWFWANPPVSPISSSSSCRLNKKHRPEHTRPPVDSETLIPQHPSSFLQFSSRRRDHSWICYHHTGKTKKIGILISYL